MDFMDFILFHVANPMAGIVSIKLCNFHFDAVPPVHSLRATESMLMVPHHLD